jgi:pimeloyl-ACP methyl ester carboxylesterase
MTSFVTSADGTPIAFDRYRSGAPAGGGAEAGTGAEPQVIVVSGLFCDRARTRDLAEALAEALPGHRVVNYDRRGRGDSGDTAPYAVEREIDDLRALVAAGDGAPTAVYGHSSGAGLALRAVAAGLPVTRLVLHEPPYGGDDDESVQGAKELAEGVRAALDDRRPGDAVRLFLGGMDDDPKLLALAPTMPYDLEVMGDFDGGRIPEALVRSIAVPTLVLAGGASPDFFRAATDRIAALLPDGVLRVIDGADHGAPADVVAPVVAEFLGRR